MESFVAEIYEYSELYTILKQGIREVRQYKVSNAEVLFNEAYVRLCDCCRKCLEAGCEYAMDFTQNVIQMSELKNDFRLLSDHMERNVLPLLQKWISSFATIDVDTGCGYRIQSSDRGYLTAQVIESGYYLHSTYDPMEEAELYIKDLFEPIYSEYVLYGCGMGYYAYQLYKVSFGSVKITIYERDVKWLEECNIVVAEVSVPSLGVGYELAFAEKLNKKVICVYDETINISAMIKGNKYFNSISYSNDEELITKLDNILKTLDINN